MNKSCEGNHLEIPSCVQQEAFFFLFFDRLPTVIEKGGGWDEGREEGVIVCHSPVRPASPSG